MSSILKLIAAGTLGYLGYRVFLHKNQLPKPSLKKYSGKADFDQLPTSGFYVLADLGNFNGVKFSKDEILIVAGEGAGITVTKKFIAEKNSDKTLFTYGPFANVDAILSAKPEFESMLKQFNGDTLTNNATVTISVTAANNSTAV